MSCDGRPSILYRDLSFTNRTLGDRTRKILVEVLDRSCRRDRDRENLFNNRSVLI